MKKRMRNNYLIACQGSLYRFEPPDSGDTESYWEQIGMVPPLVQKMERTTRTKQFGAVQVRTA